MTHKTSKTIADLNINWTFKNPEDSWNFDTLLHEFQQNNSEISKLVVTPNSNYTFVFENKEFRCGSYGFESLDEYFVHLNQAFWFKFRKEVKIRKFENIYVSNAKYIIHGK